MRPTKRRPASWALDNRFGTTLGNGAALALRGSHLLYYDDPSEGRYLMHVGGGYNVLANRQQSRRRRRRNVSGLDDS